jgi:hypothetical protein
MKNLDDLVYEIEKNKALNIQGVVEPFYCNQDDGEYNNNPCSEQCRFCKSVESLQ